MLLKNSISLLYEFFLPTLKQFRKLYLNSSIYNDKISKIENKPLTYKPTLSILSCLIKYEKQKLQRYCSNKSKVPDRIGIG